MFFKFNTYTIVWASCMFALNWGRLESLPTTQIFYFLYFDKIAHFSQFCLFAFLMLVGLRKQHSYPYLKFNAYQVTLIFTLGFAFLLEGIHYFRANIYFEFWDLIADCLGGVLGIFIFYLIYKKIHEN